MSKTEKKLIKLGFIAKGLHLEKKQGDSLLRYSGGVLTKIQGTKYTDIPLKHFLTSTV